jgi:hypothetical protein
MKEQNSEAGNCLRLGCIRFWPSEKAKEWTSYFVDFILTQQNVDAIVAVGSAIRNVTEIADVDLILIYNRIKPVFKKAPIDVDIRMYDRDDVDELLARGHDLIGWALRMGCIVYERDLYWSKLRSEWEDRLLFPSPEEATERASRAKQLYEELRLTGDIDAAEEQFISMLTHLSRAKLLKANIFPASRPELADQLKQIGEHELARELSDALAKRGKDWESRTEEFSGRRTNP